MLVISGNCFSLLQHFVPEQARECDRAHRAQVETDLWALSVAYRARRTHNSERRIL